MTDERIKDLAINEHGFMFDPTTGYSYNANKTAMLVINLLREGKKYQEIFNYLLDQYDVDRDALEKDLDFFLSQLNQYGLMEADK